MQVALTFLRDFEKSGIDLPPFARAQFVDISDSLLQLGRVFLTSAALGPSPRPLIEIHEPEQRLAGLGAQFIDSLPRKRGKAVVTPGSWEAQMIARYARDGEARRLVFMGSQRADPDRINVLETLLRQRADLAGVLGKESYAELALMDKMAKTPANVDRFLLSLAQHHKPAAAADVATLQRLKAMSLTGNAFTAESPVTLPPLNAWDRDFFTERHVQAQSPSRMLPPILPYFSTGTVLRGLSRLFSRLYGISFRPAPVGPGEVWHESVRRLDVVDEDEGRIGVIYCDLFSREGKPAAAAHYTVRCSRRVDDDDVAGDGLPGGWDSRFGPGLETAGDAIRGKEGRYQLPIVVLTTDFGTVEHGKPALLSWNDVETLFHEMGHAMHSMIGRTEFHNVSGTRCATDFVELPSILMEHFVSSPAVLSMFATHFESDEPLPLPLLQAHVGIQQSLAALETHGQIVMALLDQRYHSLRPGSPEYTHFDSTRVYHDLQNEVGVIPPAAGAAWQTQFGHLYGYGATYYSYLFDRAISGKVWASLFAADPLSREGGEVLKRKVLAFGGGRDPWEMVGDVVGGREGAIVSRGDERAMAAVGGWTVKERGLA
ncbi:Mitochondrial intermediate peptidase [Cryptotrichosporon argae]